jgi:hypothetical protein
MRANGSTTNDVVVSIDQDRDVEAEDLDAFGNLPDLLFTVTPRIAGVRLKIVD